MSAEGQVDGDVDEICKLLPGLILRQKATVEELEFLATDKVPVVHTVYVHAGCMQVESSSGCEVEMLEWLPAMVQILGFGGEVVPEYG